MKLLKTTSLAGLLFMSIASAATAANYSFTGTFATDSEVQLRTFTLDSVSDISLRTWSFAGGANVNGQAIPSGGFDPVLALFDINGDFFGQYNNGSDVADPVTSLKLDTYINISGLAAGEYTVAIMQFGNDAPDNLGSPFSRAGQGNFTLNDFGNENTPCSQFIDFGGNCRDGHWAFDVVTVEVTGNVPEPAPLALVALGLLGIASFRRRT